MKLGWWHAPSPRSERLAVWSVLLWHTWYGVTYPLFYSTSVSCNCGGPNQIKDWNLSLNCPFSPWNLNFLVVCTGFFFPVLLYFFCLFVFWEKSQGADWFVSALAFVLSLWNGSWCTAAEMVPISIYVCAASLTLLTLFAASSTLLSGGLLQGGALDKSQDLENGPCAQTSFCRV